MLVEEDNIETAAQQQDNLDEPEERPTRENARPQRYQATQFDSKGELKKPASPDDLVCEYCSETIEGDGIQCESCDKYYHLLCLGFEDRPKRTFQCLSCEVAQPHSESSDSEWLMDKTEPADDGHSDTESATASAMGLEDEETNPLKFLTAIDFAQFTNKKQYSAEEAKLRYLLKLPYNMVYKDDDQKDEKTPEHALQLLYAARLGESGLRARPSIHVNYDYLQSELDKEAPLQHDVQRRRSELTRKPWSVHCSCCMRHAWERVDSEQGRQSTSTTTFYSPSWVERPKKKWNRSQLISPNSSQRTMRPQYIQDGERDGGGEGKGRGEGKGTGEGKGRGEGKRKGEGKGRGEGTVRGLPRIMVGLY